MANEIAAASDDASREATCGVRKNVWLPGLDPKNYIKTLYFRMFF
jgi:hypothetical protein